MRNKHVSQTVYIHYCNLLILKVQNSIKFYTFTCNYYNHPLNSGNIQEPKKTVHTEY